MGGVEGGGCYCDGDNDDAATVRGCSIEARLALAIVCSLQQHLACQWRARFSFREQTIAS